MYLNQDIPIKPYLQNIICKIYWKAATFKRTSKKYLLKAESGMVLPIIKLFEDSGHCLTLVFLLESPMDRGAWRATVRRSQRVGHD